MIHYKALNAADIVTTLERNEIASFLRKYMEQYADTAENTERAIDYALSKYPHQGGFIMMATNDGGTIIGALVVNKTGMEGYLPANLLIYLAVHTDFRRQGIGTELLKRTLKLAKKSIALHIEPNNPAKSLFEKFGFESKYLEMRASK